MVNQLLMVTLADAFLSDHSSSEVALLLDVWEVGKTMRWAGAGPTCARDDSGLARRTPMMPDGTNLQEKAREAVNWKAPACAPDRTWGGPGKLGFIE